MKSLSEMSNGELRNVWLSHKSANVRTGALREYERRRAEMPAKVRDAFDQILDFLGADEGLTLIADYMEKRIERMNEEKGLQWAVRVDELREMVDPSED